MNKKEHFNKEIRPVVGQELGIKNTMRIPEIKKVVINMGTGELLRNNDTKEKLMNVLSTITGQKPKVQNAKTSIAGFNLREGSPVGLTVTLRGERMFSFLEKLIMATLPRLRDFRGVPTKSFDKQGNYTLGLAEFTVFPEIDVTKVDKNHGLEITIVTSAKDEKEAKVLLEKIGMPFQKEDK